MQILACSLQLSQLLTSSSYQGKAIEDHVIIPASLINAAHSENTG